MPIPEQRLLAFISRLTCHSVSGIKQELIYEIQSSRLSAPVSNGAKLSDQQIQEWADRYDLPDPIGELRCMIEDARTLDPQPDTGWLPIEQWKIESGRAVLVSYLNRLSKRRIVKGMYINKFTEEASSDGDYFEYCDEDDTYYVPEGWYECIDNWDEFASIAIHEGVIDFVRPLPPSPTPEGSKG